MTGILLPILFAIISAGLYFSYIEPMYGEVQTLEHDSGEYDKLLNSAKQIRDKRAELTEQYKRLNADGLAKLHKMVPDHIDNVRLLIDIDNIASSHGLRIKNIKFPTQDQDNKPSSTDAPASANSTETGEQGSAPSVGNQAYKALSMSFTVAASYDDMISFLKDLEKSLRVLDVMSVALTSGGDSGQKSGTTGLYSYQVTLSTYWLPN